MRVKRGATSGKFRRNGPRLSSLFLFRRDVARQKREESVLIPSDLDPAGIQGLRNEARDALLRYRPDTLGQAGRIEGITPSDLTLLAIAIKRRSQR